MPYLVRKRVRRGPNPDWMAGQTITDEEARTASRFRLLLQNGFVEPAEPDRAPEEPPLVLQDHTISELRDVLPSVTDVALLREALQTDPRSTARGLYEDRLEELEE